MTKMFTIKVQTKENSLITKDGGNHSTHIYLSREFRVIKRADNVTVVNFWQPMKGENTDERCVVMVVDGDCGRNKASDHYPAHVTCVIVENPNGQTTEIVRTGIKLSSVEKNIPPVLVSGSAGSK